MSDHFFSYYEHLAKLAQIANKQTLFLAHLLYQMKFDSETYQNVIDLSTREKKRIMRLISPDTDESRLLTYADQYLAKLKKAGFITNVDSGVWLVDPKCFGQYKHIPKDLRNKNAKVFANFQYDSEGVVKLKTKVEDE